MCSSDLSLSLEDKAPDALFLLESDMSLEGMTEASFISESFLIEYHDSKLARLLKIKVRTFELEKLDFIGNEWCQVHISCFHLPYFIMCGCQLFNKLEMTKRCRKERNSDDSDKGVVMSLNPLFFDAIISTKMISVNRIRQ